MHDIGALVWVIVVVIGVISSIVQNARKAAASRSGGPARAAAAAQQLRAPAPVRVVSVAPSFVSAEPPPAALPVTQPAAASFSAPEAPQMPGALRLPASFHLDYVERSRTTGYIAGMFKDRKAFVRAIVAAEVLGKPKALQEQSIWSPRHSEPSI